MNGAYAASRRRCGTQGSSARFSPKRFSSPGGAPRAGTDGEHILPGPGLGPVRIHPRRQTSGEADAQAPAQRLPAEAGELLIGQPLQPAHERDLLGVFLGECRHGRRLRAAIRGRPIAPTAKDGVGGAEMLLQRFEAGVVLQRFAALGAEQAEGARPFAALRQVPVAEVAVDQPEYLHLGCPHLVAGDLVAGAQPAQPGLEAIRRHAKLCAVALGELRYGLDVEVERADEATAGWTAGIDSLRQQGMQRPRADHAAAGRRR